VDSTLALDPCPFIEEGDPVRVVAGPLSGVKGRLLRKGTDARLVVSVELIGRAVSVQVHAADVRAL
jgi:transcription antitermination factor NusG